MPAVDIVDLFSAPVVPAGERVALVVTAGLPDLLHIGNQSRPDIFDLKIQTPENLYEVSGTAAAQAAGAAAAASAAGS